MASSSSLVEIQSHDGCRTKPRKENFMKDILNGNKKKQALSFLKRDPTLQKKAMELQTLCDVSVCMVSLGRNGTFTTWPEDEEEVKKAIMFYKGLDAKKKHESSLFGYLKDRKRKLELKIQKVIKKKVDSHTAIWSNKIDGLSGDALVDSVKILESKLLGLKERIELLKVQDDERKGTGNHPDHVGMDLEVDDRALVPCTSNGGADEISALPSIDSRALMDTNNDVNNIGDVSNNCQWDGQITYTNIKKPVLVENFGDNSGQNTITTCSLIHEAIPMSVWEPQRPLEGMEFSSNILWQNVCHRSYNLLGFTF